MTTQTPTPANETPDNDNQQSDGIVTFEIVRDDSEVQAFITQANRSLATLGYTEHGFRHVGLCANIARNVLRLLDYDARTQELAAIAAYTHDIGNVVSRHGHAATGALLAYSILTRLGMSPDELGVIMSAIGTHDGDDNRVGEVVNAVSAALILADKSDVHRSRVRNTDVTTFDNHDRVNYAATQSFLRVDASEKTITLELTIDLTIASVMQYFEIFMPRMQMCRRAANYLDCTFRITMNEIAVL
jgi:metal-dependent HD superfamily phosphatase/phosphodiesterase